MPRKILVALDGSAGSESAVRDAAVLARARRATLRLLHVAPPPEPTVVDGRVVVYADQVAADRWHETMCDLRRVASTISGVSVELAVRFGEPVAKIVEDAESAGADLIAMATHRRTGLRRLLEGSIADRVKRATRLPVLLVGHRRRYGPRLAA